MGFNMISNRKVCIDTWFTNNTHIPGEQSLPDSMLGEGGMAGRNKPWFAPGTAPIQSPCGVYGGNPAGCRPGDDTEMFGDCCGEHCGGFSFGAAAELWDWPDAPVTEWSAGSVQQVANNYAYILDF